MQKFNGYEYVTNELQQYEKKNLQPVDIVYEPPKNVGEPIQCYFAPKMYMAFSTYFNSGNKMVRSHAIRQCPYCENFFEKSEEKTTAHVK